MQVKHTYEIEETAEGLWKGTLTAHGVVARRIYGLTEEQCEFRCLLLSLKLTAAHAREPIQITDVATGDILYKNRSARELSEVRERMDYILLDDRVIYSYLSS